MTDTQCGICKRTLNIPDNALSYDCGGDCLACVICAEDGEPAPDLPKAELDV
jgi:hypothetical protein